MNVPRSIDYHHDQGQRNSRDRDRSDRVSSPTRTIDGTSTIESATSEPTTETPRPKQVRKSSAQGSNRMTSARRTGNYVPRGSQTFKRSGPINYSKSRGNGVGNFSPREVDDKTRAVLADLNDFDANEGETENLADDIFSPGTGIADEEVRKIMRVRVSSKQMDLDQQVAAGNKVIKRLKDTLTALTKGKNEFVHSAVDAEKSARNGWAQALETAQLLDEDRGFFKQKVKQLEVDNTIWKDNAKDTMRELSLSEDKMQNLRN